MGIFQNADCREGFFLAGFDREVVIYLRPDARLEMTMTQRIKTRDIEVV